MNQKIKIADKTNSYTITSFYNYYLDNIEKDTVYDIPYSVYRKIITEYFQYIRDEVIEKGKRVRMPNRMGTIQIVKKQPKFWDKRSLRLDYNETKKTGKLVYLLNEHSNFYKYRFHWDKTDILTHNKTWYQLVMTRSNKRHLAQLIKNKEMDYEEV